MSALPAGGKPTRRKRARKSTEEQQLDEVARLRNALAYEYVRHTEEEVALHERIAELEVGVAEIAAVFQRVDSRSQGLDHVILADEEAAFLRARTAALVDRPAAALARRRKGKVSKKKPYRQLILADEKLKRELWVADDPAEMAIAYLDERGIAHPNKRNMRGWLVIAGLIPP
jgi:hypothetical protein